MRTNGSSVTGQPAAYRFAFHITASVWDPSVAKELIFIFYFWEGVSLPYPDACPQEISCSVHLAAPGAGLGLEPGLVRGDSPRTPGADAAAPLDAAQAAE